MAANWLDNLQKLAGELREDLQRGGRIVLIGSEGPNAIVPYRGFGNQRRVLVQGRAIQSRNIAPSSDADSTFRNLVNTYKRARAYPLRAARIEATLHGKVEQIIADDEGFFRHWIDLPENLPATEPWLEAELRLLSHAQADLPEVRTTARVRVPTTSAAFGVISDLDDTVIQSRVSNFLLAVRTVMLGNARTRLPFPGVAAFYQALEKGSNGQRLNPVYYVSSSPWNIHDLI